MNETKGLRALVQGYDRSQQRELALLVRSLSNEALEAEFGAIASEGIDERSASAFRATGHELLKSVRLLPAGQVFITLVRSPFKARDDLFGLAHAILGYQGLLKNADLARNALSVMSMLTFLDQNDFDAWMNIVRIWFDMPAEAINADELRVAVDTCVRLRPDLVDTHFQQAMFFQAVGDISAATRAYEQALSLDPGHCETRFRMWLMAKGGKSDGPADLKLELDLAPEDMMTDDSAAGARIFRDFGGVVLRDAVSSDGLEDLSAELAPWLKEQTSGRPISSIDFREAAGSVQDRLLGHLQNSQIEEKVLQTLGRWGGKGWNPHPHGTWWMQYHEPDDPKPKSMHQDYPVSADVSDWFTIWMPFIECGPGIAPSLEILPLRFDHPVHFEGRHGNFINAVRYDDVVDYFGPSMLRPRFQPGDILVFHKTTLHRTYTEAERGKTRISFDCRFQLGASPSGFPDIQAN